MTDISAWAAVDDSNNIASPAGWPEGMMPSGVNNSARANMGSLKRWRDQSQPTVVATGTANAQVITYPVAPAALAHGDVFRFYNIGANTGPVTLQINGQAPVAVRHGNTGILSGGELEIGAITSVVYDANSNLFRLISPPSFVPVSMGGTGATTPAGAATAIGAVAKTGDTMTGALTTTGLQVNGAAGTGNLTVNGDAGVSGRLTAGQVHAGAFISDDGIQYPSYGLTSPATNIGFGYSYANGQLWFVANGSAVGYISYSVSDERLKRDIRPITVDPLAAISRVQLKAFNQLSIRNDPNDGARPYDVGFIAQQLQKIIPDAVIEPSPEMENAYLGLDLLPLVAYCVGAIQQLANRVDALETALVK